MNSNHSEEFSEYRRLIISELERLDKQQSKMEGSMGALEKILVRIEHTQAAMAEHEKTREEEAKSVLERLVTAEKDLVAIKIKVALLGAVGGVGAAGAIEAIQAIFM